MRPRSVPGMRWSWTAATWLVERESRGACLFSRSVHREIMGRFSFDGKSKIPVPAVGSAISASRPGTRSSRASSSTWTRSAAAKGSGKALSAGLQPVTCLRGVPNPRLTSPTGFERRRRRAGRGPSSRGSRAAACAISANGAGSFTRLRKATGAAGSRRSGGHLKRDGCPVWK